MPSISVVVPALDEASVLPALLENLKSQAADQIIVADGGSTDETARIAASAGAVVVSAPRGRARQMNAGAEAATGDVLLFLHADVTLSAGALTELRHALADSRVIGGNFDCCFGGEDWTAKVFNWIYRARLPFGIFYGDSGIWLRRQVFRQLEGYRDIPIMEDYDLARRMWRYGLLAHLRSRIFVSPRRWRNAGLGKTLLVWVLIQTGFSAGVPPRYLAWMYQKVR
jgi:rSAM/selenodomain-associated transferase 2